MKLKIYSCSALPLPLKGKTIEIHVCAQCALLIPHSTQPTSLPNPTAPRCEKKAYVLPSLAFPLSHVSKAPRVRFVK